MISRRVFIGSAFSAALAAPAWAQFNWQSLDPTKIGQGVGKMAKGASGIGFNEEVAIGGAVAVQIVGTRGGVWKEAAAMQRVNLIGKSLARFSERPTLPFRFGLLAADDINAFSAPAGYVFITRGAYQAATDDDQLAGVLAHEIMHVVRRHALRIIARGEFITGMAQVASGTGTDYGAFDLGVDKVTNTLFQTGYDSNSENDADKGGRALAYATGFAEDGLKKFLMGLQAKSQAGSMMFSTHPPLQNRIQKLQ
jgi:predicted Zn-dependent protease